MNKEFINFIWEVCKLIIPSFVAWKLAVNQSKKDAKKNEKNMKEQIKEWRDKNIESQNKSNKLQFCLNKLSEIEINYEKMISDINTLVQSVKRLYLDNNAIIDVKMSAEQINAHMHEIMYSIGLTGELVKAVSWDDYERFEIILKKMKESGNLIEKEMSNLAQIKGQVNDINRISNLYNETNIEKFNDAIFNARNFIINVISDVLGEMDQEV